MEENLRRIAASKVFILKEEGHVEYTNHVVELYDHMAVNHFALQGEIAMTEWLGGTLIIKNREVYHCRMVLSPTELSTYDSGSNGYIERL